MPKIKSIGELQRELQLRQKQVDKLQARRAKAKVDLRSIQTAMLAKDRLGAFLVAGALAAFVFQVIYNVTMSAGLAPVKGLTLPLMSYGGSSVIATLAGFGLIVNVRMRRFTN